MEGKELIKRIFAVLSLIKLLEEGNKVCFKSLTGLILILLNEASSSKLRMHAINLAHATISAWKNVSDDSGAILVF